MELDKIVVVAARRQQLASLWAGQTSGQPKIVIDSRRPTKLAGLHCEHMHTNTRITLACRVASKIWPIFRCHEDTIASERERERQQQQQQQQKPTNQMMIVVSISLIGIIINIVLALVVYFRRPIPLWPRWPARLGFAGRELDNCRCRLLANNWPIRSPIRVGKTRARLH